MLDATFYKENKEPMTVEELMEILKTLDPETRIAVEGDEYFYLHLDKDPEGKEPDTLIFDNNSLADEYPVQIADAPEGMLQVYSPKEGAKLIQRMKDHLYNFYEETFFSNPEENLESIRNLTMEQVNQAFVEEAARMKKEDYMSGVIFLAIVKGSTASWVIDDDEISYQIIMPEDRVICENIPVAGEELQKMK
jgi:hypothetical protein